MRTWALTILAGTTSLAVLLGACSSSSSPMEGTAAATGTATVTAATATPSATATVSAGGETSLGATHEDPEDLRWDEADEIQVTLSGDSATADGEGITINGSSVTITDAGTYRVRGALTDGQLIVDAAEDAVVRVVLDGVEIANSSNAAIAILQAEKAVIVLAEGQENWLSDSSEYVFADPADDEPNAALFSKVDLTIGGSGQLRVEGNFNDGIASKDGLVIAGGTISVEAADDGVRGKDYVVIRDGDVTVVAGGDGLKADNEEDAALGYVLVDGGDISITAGGDGIDAATSATVNAGALGIEAGGGASATLTAGASAKGIKGAALVSISGGSLAIDSADDAIHSNVGVTIGGGTFTIATGDDAVHADTTLTINGGEMEVTQSYEGLESASLTINDGTIAIQSSDDGINAAGGVDGSGLGGPGVDGFRPAGGGFGGQAGDYALAINGGTILVNAGGDGIDSNGALTMTGGTAVVQGPTANNNSAIDYDGSFVMSGGVLVAAGSSGMAMAPGTGSTQASIHIHFQSVQAAGTLVHVQSGSGEAIVTFEAAKTFQSLVVSTPAISEGESYEVYTSGTASGGSLNGLYEAGAYTPGTQAGSVGAVLAEARTGMGRP